MKNARTAGVAVRRGAMALYAVLAVGAVLAGPAGATGPTPITDCSSNSAPAAIAADFEAGGSYIFECGTSRSFVDFTSTITVSTDLTVTAATGQPISLLGYVAGGRFMTIEGGTVSLSNLYIADFTQASAPSPPFSPTNGTDGTNGTSGTSGAAPGDNGTNGTNGGPGGQAPNGADGNPDGPAQGGALLIDSGATVTLTNDTFDTNEAYGQEGGAGGAGGFGGAAGSGGIDGTTAGGSDGNGGNGGTSGNGGAGGTGGIGGNAQGGAIYNAGNLTIAGTTFSNNSATGGLGGYGGNGGGVWPGGYGGVGCDDDVYEGDVYGSGGVGGAAGTAGNAGAGGNGGTAQGGAVYNTGTLTLQTGDAFTSNASTAGNGGIGGNNQQSYTYSESDSGGGSYGSGSGGGPGGPAGTWTFANHDGDGPPVHTGCGSGGAGGGPGGPGASEPGGAAGSAQGGAIYDEGTVSASAAVSFTTNTATGGHGGTGGNGGGGGGGGAGGNQPGDVQNEFNANPFGASPGDNTSPTDGADGSSGGNGGYADSGAFVSTSKTLLENAICSGNGVTGGAGGGGGSGGSGGGAVYESGQSNGSSGTNGAGGSQGGSTNPQANCADELDVTVDDPAEPGGTPAKLNAIVPVTVKVSAPATNHDTVSAIGFSGSPVQWTPATGPNTPLTSTDDTAPAPFSLAPGTSSSFTFHVTVVQLETIAISSSVSGTDPSGAVTASGGNSILTSTPLQVTVTTNPDTPIQLQDTVNGWVPKPVNAIVTVKNVGSTAISQVTLDDQFVITTASGTPKVAEIPIDQPKNGPTPSDQLGTLAPGQSAQGTYALNVRGDGKYDLSALADGISSAGTKVSGTGDEVVEIDGPVLIWKADLPNPNALIPAGRTFLVNVHLENNSYQKTLDVDPMHALLTGNAQDGHVQLAGEAIPSDQTTEGCDAGESEQLDPQTTKDFEAVIRTASSDPALMGANGPGGGTRAEITFDDPTGNVVNDDGTLGAALDPTADEVIAPDSQDFIAHIDDKGFPAQAPKSWIPATWYFSKGLAIGAGEALIGMVHGVFVDIPKLILHGIVGLPHALLTYAQLEAELWNDVKDHPALQAAYLSAVGNAVLLAYKETPLLEQQAQQAYASVNAAVLAHYTQLWTQWFAGDWKTALTTMGEESGDAATNLGLLLAPCMLAKLPSVAAAYDTAKGVAFARAADLLAQYPEALSWVRAIKALGEVVPGFEFTNADLIQFAGVDGRDATWLRDIAKPSADFPDGLLVTFRPRSAEAAELLSSGKAVLKPDAIKLKTVSDQIDVQFLGYSKDAASRIAIRELPKGANGKPSLSAWEGQIESALRRQGFTQTSPEWVAAMQRAAFRFNDETKYVKQLERYAKQGEVTLNWDLASNLMDPSLLTSTPTTYPFRLTKLPNGDRLAEFFVKGRWRAVTGDIDFLDIAGGNGKPLTLAQQAKAYQAFSSGPVGMPHGFSAMWADPAESNPFDFPLKRDQFTKGTAVQVGPDGIARAVTFNNDMSEFKGLDYHIQWNGGYELP